MLFSYYIKYAQCVLSALLISIALVWPSTSFADKICLRIRASKLSKTIVDSSANCPKSYTEIVDLETIQNSDKGEPGEKGDPGDDGAIGPPGAAGPQGLQGSSGIDGSVRVYGDGSAGSYVTPIIEFGALAELPNSNLQFTDFTVPNGTRLEIGSGITIRATGTCTINGDVSVYKAASSGNSGSSTGIVRPVNTGLTLRAPEFRRYGNVSAIGGQGGLSNLHGALIFGILSPPFLAGSGGGSGGSGGGSVRLLCRELIAIGVNGKIAADGGSGGGGGGLIILASPSEIRNEGILSVMGGDGGSGRGALGNSGGGGGGLIRLLAPTITSGIVALNGGDPGDYVVAAADPPPVASGSGGGAGIVGSGGDGASIRFSQNSISLSSDATAGEDGELLLTQADPTSLMIN